MAKLAPPNKYNGVVSLAQDAPETGLPLLQDLARQYPADSRVRHALGVTLLHLGQYGRAVPELEAAAKRERQYAASIQEALAVAYGALGMPLHAARALKRAGKADENADDPAQLIGDVPAGAKTADLLEFEQARFEVLQGAAQGGLKRIEQFVARFPDYLPAQNILATGKYLSGDFAQARAATLRVLETAPRNIHALLNLARLELLEHGEDAARTLTPRVEVAQVQPEQGVTDGELARANFFALLNDDANVERALNAWESDPERRANDPQAAFLEDRLHLRRDEADAGPTAGHPYFLLRELLPSGLMQRWRTLGEKRVAAKMLADLQALPGWLALVPDRLGFETPEFARMVTHVLLDDDAEKWADVLRTIVTRGPGTTEGRLAVGAELQQRGLLPDEVVAELPGSAEGARLLQLELSTEPEPTPLTPGDDAVFKQSIYAMRDGRFEEARAALEPLARRYPDYPSLLFNLALAEQHCGDAQARARGEARVEQLAGAHPNYLFARAQLADDAIKAGNLERARELLRFPEGLKRLHAQEWATFTSVGARLALIEGRRDEAERTLQMIGDLVGEDEAAYILLQRELFKTSWPWPLGKRRS